MYKYLLDSVCPPDFFYFVGFSALVLVLYYAKAAQTLTKISFSETYNNV